MSRAVVDSSILLAILRGEPHADHFLDKDTWVVVSTVNLAEVISRLISFTSEREAWREALDLPDEIVSFDVDQARLAGNLIQRTRRLGLSLGDRACLALGLTLGLPVYTADRAWSGLENEPELGLEVRVVR